MRNRVACKILVAGVFALAGSLAQAYSCIGPVTGVSVSPAGIVSGTSIGGISWGYFCNVSTPQNGVSVESCRAVLATLLSAEAQGKSVEIWFDDGFSCATRPAWAWQTAWYWGPRIVS